MCHVHSPSLVEAGAPANEIEITPEMIGRAVTLLKDEMTDYHGMWYDPSRVVKLIIREAMGDRVLMEE
jgi:hypothetical protein